MDLTDGQQLSETTTSDPTADTEWATCRLRHALNEDCLLKVMEFLNIYDLMHMSNTDSYFKDLITKWIVGKKLINLRGMTKTGKDEIFETFGKTMRKFIVYESHFRNFIDAIIKYCTPNRLTEVELNLKQPMLENLKNVHLLMPYLTKIRKFKLNVLRFQRFSTFDEFLTGLVASAPNLHYLQLFHVEIQGNWLKTNKLLNLRELRILEPCFVSVPELRTFLHCIPNLIQFTYKGNEDITAVGSTLIECCPNLETFEDIHTANVHRRFALEDVNRYNFLASFSNLNSVTLTSYTFCGCDLYYPLVKLASRNVIQLKIYANLDNASNFDEMEHKRIMKTCSFANFLSLLNVELDVRNYRFAGELRCEFILLFATKLKNLEKFTLQSSRLANANRIIELLPHCRTISISQITFKHLPVEMRKIVRTLRMMRQANDDNDRVLLQLVVNIEQWRELQVYNDIDKLANTVIDPYVETYNHFRRCPSDLET